MLVLGIMSPEEEAEGWGGDSKGQELKAVEAARQVAAGCPRHLLWPKRTVIPQVFSYFHKCEAESYFRSSLNSEISLGACCRL